MKPNLLTSSLLTRVLTNFSCDHVSLSNTLYSVQKFVLFEMQEIPKSNISRRSRSRAKQKVDAREERE